MRQVAYLIFAPPAYFSGEHDLVLCHEQGLAGLLDPAGLESLQRLVKLVWEFYVLLYCLHHPPIGILIISRTEMNEFRPEVLRLFYD